MKIEKRHKIQIGHPDEITIILVGCGGTGSFAALNLARLATATTRLNIKLVFVDFDMVEEKNIGRQYFCPADIGQPKARVLATRLGLAFGLIITPVVASFGDKVMTDHAPKYSYNGRLTLIVGCVDNTAARQDIARAIEAGLEGGVLTQKPVWWLDAGNSNMTGMTGQILIGNTLNPQPLLSKFGECIGLPLPSIQEPAIIQPPSPAPIPEAEAAIDLDCADLVQAGAQARTINYMMAAWLDVYIERLLVTHDLDVMNTILNQRIGSAYSAPISDGMVVETDIGQQATPGADPDFTDCPACGGHIVEGEDIIEGEAAEIVFCPGCDWQMLRAEFERLNVVRQEVAL